MLNKEEVKILLNTLNEIVFNNPSNIGYEPNEKEKDVLKKLNNLIEGGDELV